MPPPLPRRSVWTYRFAHFIQTYQPSPKGLSGRPAHCPFRGLLGVHSRCGLHTRAVTNSRHANRRLQPLRYLHDCSDCFRLERLPGGACTHWKAPPFHGARQKPSFRRRPADRNSPRTETLITVCDFATAPNIQFDVLATSDFGDNALEGLYRLTTNNVGVGQEI